MANNNTSEVAEPSKAERKTPTREYAGKKGRHQKVEAPRNLIVATLLILIAWAIFILLYALYWSTGFNTFQNVIVTLVSLFITGLSIGLIWVALGPRGYWTPK